MRRKSVMCYRVVTTWSVHGPHGEHVTQELVWYDGPDMMRANTAFEREKRYDVPIDVDGNRRTTTAETREVRPASSNKKPPPKPKKRR